jgi:hypothetical protein
VALKHSQIYDETVSETPGTQKFRAASRVIGRRAGESRWSRASYQAGRTFLGTASRVVRVLWHEVTGFFFLVFGLIVGFGAYREYLAYRAGKVGSGRAALAACLAMLFIYFALSGFRRAKSKSK